MNTLIQHGHNKLIKSDSTEIYNKFQIMKTQISLLLSHILTTALLKWIH